MGTTEHSSGGNTSPMAWHPVQGEVDVFTVTSCFMDRHRDDMQ